MRKKLLLAFLFLSLLLFSSFSKNNLDSRLGYDDDIVVIDDSTIKDIIIPNKDIKDDYDSNYYKYVKEFLLDD